MSKTSIIRADFYSAITIIDFEVESAFPFRYLFCKMTCISDNSAITQESYVGRQPMEAMNFGLDLKLNLPLGVLCRIFWNLVPLWRAIRILPV
jgi:hypothetical protein